MGGPTQSGTSAVSIQDPQDGLQADVIQTDGYNGSVVVTPGHVSTKNSTSTPLLADAVYTGDWEEITNYGIIVVSTTSNVSSATDGLVLQFSTDATVSGIVSTDEFTLVANAKKTWSFQSAAKYYRVVYTNGGTGQTSFNLQTILKPYYVKPSSHRIQDTIVDDDDAELIKAVITGKNPAGSFVNFQATTAGNFKVSLEELESGVSEDTNTTLRVTNIIIDEYGEIQRILGDNIFRGAIVVNEIEHHEIHCGDSYEITFTGDLSNGATVDILIITPNWGTVDATNSGDNQSTKIAHLKFIIDTEAEALVTFFEGPTYSATGAATDPVNRNFNSENVDYLGFYSSPTITTTGTNRYSKRIGSGNKIGGAAGRGDEYVLENNAAYLLRVTNATALNNYYNIEFDYYVHPGI